jgi:hypothetical protein
LLDVFECGEPFKGFCRLYQLLSWWDMKPFPVIQFLQFVRDIEREVRETDSSEKPAAETITEKNKLLKDIDEIAKTWEEYSLSLTADQFRRMAEAIKKNATNAELRKFLPDLLNRLEDECNRLLFMRIEPAHLQYFENAQFFDPKDSKAKKVSTEFPSAAEDIAEAGKCLACGRSTACVLHLGRVLEIGLKALATAVGVKSQNDWGRYLGEIEKELNNRVKISGARTSAEQFYAEAHLMFDNVRRAWRNPTMHPDKTYTSERAEEILTAVGSFMRHLATELHE